MDRRKALTMLFAMYGQEKATERLEAYLIAFSALDDNAVQFAIREAAEGRIGDPAFFPTAPQLAKIAAEAPPPPVAYQRLNDLPPVYEMGPGNTKRVTQEAIEFYGLEQVSEWCGRRITPAMIAATPREDKLLPHASEGPAITKRECKNENKIKQ